jgi:Circularly permutated YpsA SLOG family
MPLLKIISGGQTGVDRGALDTALGVHFPCGGWYSADRRAEDGTVPEKYPMTALPRAGYRARTRKNVEDSDGTVILAPELTVGPPSRCNCAAGRANRISRSMRR